MLKFFKARFKDVLYLIYMLFMLVMCPLFLIGITLAAPFMLLESYKTKFTNFLIKL